VFSGVTAESISRKYFTLLPVFAGDLDTRNTQIAIVSRLAACSTSADSHPANRRDFFNSHAWFRQLTQSIPRLE
jgi:hypothetical protein